MDCYKLCGEILKLNPKIRFAGVYHITSGEVYEKTAKGLERLFDKEQTKKSLIQAYMRWKTRESISNISGAPVYALTKYEKLTRITMTCGKNAILMVSTENDLEIHEIVDDIINLREKYADDETYAPELRQASVNF